MAFNFYVFTLEHTIFDTFEDILISHHDKYISYLFFIFCTATHLIVLAIVVVHQITYAAKEIL